MSAGYRLTLYGDTAGEVMVPAGTFDTLAEAQAEGEFQVRARSGGQQWRASIHDLDEQGQATHWRGLNTETMTWRRPKAVER